VLAERPDSAPLPIHFASQPNAAARRKAVQPALAPATRRLTWVFGFLLGLVVHGWKHCAQAILCQAHLSGHRKAHAPLRTVAQFRHDDGWARENSEAVDVFITLLSRLQRLRVPPYVEGPNRANLPI